MIQLRLEETHMKYVSRNELETEENSGIREDLINTQGEYFLSKNGTVYGLPVSRWNYLHIPVMPSECDEMIKLFENLRDNFTDEECRAFNEQSREDTMRGKGH